MSSVLTQWLAAFVHNHAGLRISNNFPVQVRVAINDTALVHPSPGDAVQLLASLALDIRLFLTNAFSFRRKKFTYACRVLNAQMKGPALGRPAVRARQRGFVDRGFVRELKAASLALNSSE
jgi:hypothetical protein